MRKMVFIVCSMKCVAIKSMLLRRIKYIIKNIILEEQIESLYLLQMNLRDRTP